MAGRSARTYRMYARLLVRDLSRSAKKLIRTKHVRGQLIITLTRPSYRTSQYYLSQLRRTRQQTAPLRRSVAASLLLLGIGIGGVTYALVQLSGMQPSVPTVAAVAQTKETQTATHPSMKASLPVHISIPDVAIDTDIIQLGKNDDGSMETPVSYDVAGWYKYSPTPGELGPSVITGHVDNYKGAAVFYRLRELQPGEKVMVTRQDGSTATFTVSKLEQFDQDHFPTDAVYGNTDDSELRIITCGGPFNHATGEYTQNTVVYATLASS